AEGRDLNDLHRIRLGRFHEFIDATRALQLALEHNPEGVSPSHRRMKQVHDRAGIRVKIIAPKCLRKRNRMLSIRLEGADNAVEVSLHYFHVRVRHRLLLQPHGFEGLTLVFVDLDSGRATISESVDLPVRRHLYLDAAVLSATALTAAHDDGLPGVDELLRVCV